MSNFDQGLKLKKNHNSPELNNNLTIQMHNNKNQKKLVK